MPNTKHITVDQASTLMTGFATKADARFQKIADVDDYTITKAGTADTGYAATYQLFKGETAVGDKINIPKDMVVQSATVETVTTADVPYAGAQVGDKYIDMVIANAASNHVYIPVNDLVDVYTAGNGIAITNNAIAVAIDSSNANGLDSTASGVKLDLATTSTAGAMSAADKAKLDSADVTAYTGTGAIDITNHVVSVAAAAASTSGVGGNAGTMSAADKEKLDNADVTAYTPGNGIDITGHAVSANVVAGNGLSVDSAGIAMGVATTSAAGAMSASDKSKLDNADVTAYTGTGAVSVLNHEISVAAATTSAAGTMSAADKTKLDGLETATDQEVQAILDGIWPAA